MLDMFNNADRDPGRLQLWWWLSQSKSDEDVNDIKLKEVNNGRLAVMAIGGMVHRNLVVKGLLFPLFPEGWTGPQGSRELVDVMGCL